MALSLPFRFNTFPSEITKSKSSLKIKTRSSVSFHDRISASGAKMSININNTEPTRKLQFSSVREPKSQDDGKMKLTKVEVPIWFFKFEVQPEKGLIKDWAVILFLIGRMLWEVIGKQIQTKFHNTIQSLRRHSEMSQNDEDGKVQREILALGEQRNAMPTIIAIFVGVLVGGLAWELLGEYIKKNALIACKYVKQHFLG